MQPANKHPGMDVEGKIARREVGNNVFRSEPGEGEIYCSAGWQIFEAVPAKTVRPITLPGSTFPLFDLQARDVHLEGVLTFRKQEHPSAAQDEITQRVVQKRDDSKICPG